MMSARIRATECYCITVVTEKPLNFCKIITSFNTREYSGHLRHETSLYYVQPCYCREIMRCRCNFRSICQQHDK